LALLQALALAGAVAFLASVTGAPYCCNSSAAESVDDFFLISLESSATGWYFSAKVAMKGLKPTGLKTLMPGSS